jgi:hypothetical protein
MNCESYFDRDAIIVVCTLLNLLDKIYLYKELRNLQKQNKTHAHLTPDDGRVDRFCFLSTTAMFSWDRCRVRFCFIALRAQEHTIPVVTV